MLSIGICSRTIVDNDKRVNCLMCVSTTQLHTEVVITPNGCGGRGEALFRTYISHKWPLLEVINSASKHTIKRLLYSSVGIRAELYFTHYAYSTWIVSSFFIFLYVAVVYVKRKGVFE